MLDLSISQPAPARRPPSSLEPVAIDSQRPGAATSPSGQVLLLSQRLGAASYPAANLPILFQRLSLPHPCHRCFPLLTGHYSTAQLSAIIPSLSPGHSSSLHSARSTFPLHLLLATPPGPAAIPSPAATPSHCDSLRPLFPLQPKPASPLPSSALDQFPLLAQSPAISSSSVLAVNCCFHSQRPPFSLPAQSHSQQPFSFPALSPRSLISLHSVRPDFSLHSQRLAPVASCFSLLLFFLFRLQIHLHRLPPVAAPPLSPTCEPPAAIPPALQPLALSCLWQPSTCTT
ncbi:hypothetical protein MRB53_002102 [Persea americana]|uniref:Uncharacterized protein n=1 Tax=Persea americana TaxID=3435 RepID=A0ACC2MV63_PERAE|nr:hypothetical protein MRB53_002102 [Persea americana]